MKMLGSFQHAMLGSRGFVHAYVPRTYKNKNHEKTTKTMVPLGNTKIAPQPQASTKRRLTTMKVDLFSANIQF